MASLDSFRCRKTLQVGDRTYTYYSLVDAEKNGLDDISKLPFSMKVLVENLLRYEDGRTVKKADIEACAAWVENKGKTEQEIAFRPARVLMQDFTGVARGSRPRRHARCHVEPRRRPAEDQPDGAGRPRDRPFRDRRCLRHRPRAEDQRRPRIFAQWRALQVPEMGAGLLRQLPRGAARHGHLPPGQSRVPGANRVDQGRGRRRGCLSRLARRHRFAHHHGQRPVRARLGRRWHRGRGLHAGPAALHAAARGHRLPPHRRAQGRRPPRPTSCSP